MQKKLFVLILSICLIVGMNSNAVYAASRHNKIVPTRSVVVPTVPVVVPAEVPIVPVVVPIVVQTVVPTGNQDGFENKIASFWRTDELPANSYAATISNNYAESGSTSLRVELHKSQIRSELKVTPEKPLEEHWYSFSVLLPNGGAEDYLDDPNSQEILAQWHNVPDAGEAYTSPPAALLTSQGHWVINRLWDDAAITSNQQMEQKGFESFHDLGSYKNDKGTWVDWKFHIKWGWLKSQNPIFEVYKNGVKVLDCDGLPNTTNDKVGMYMKLGIYKWDWVAINDPSIIDKRITYYDQVKIQ